MASNITYTLTPDTNVHDQLVSSFIISGMATGLLYDKNSDGTIDRLVEEYRWTDQYNVTQTVTVRYVMSWSDSETWTAKTMHEMTFGSQYDSQGRPTTLSINNGEAHSMLWQTKDVDNVVATVSFQSGDLPVVLKFIDSIGNDNIPDAVRYDQGTGPAAYTAQADLVGWTFDSSLHPTSVSAVIQTSTSVADVFSGTILGPGSDPTAILMPSFGNVSDITLNTTGSVSGTPQSGETYYAFSAGTGVIAKAGQNWFRLDLTADSDNNPITFNAGWNWLNSSGQITSTDTGVLTFLDNKLSVAGPELWRADFKFIETGDLLADSNHDGKSDGIVFSNAFNDSVDVPLTWQARDADGVMATFSAMVKDEHNNDISFTGSLIDLNSDNLPDRVVGTQGSDTFGLQLAFIDTNSDGVADQYQITRTETLTGRVQVDSSGNPAGLYVTSSGINSHPLMTHNGVGVNPETYSGPATAAGEQPILYQYLGGNGGDVLQGTGHNDFINVGAGDDAVNAGEGNDVIDGGTGSNFLTGGPGSDIFFCDGRGGGVTWSTITDWQAGEQLSVWGWRPGISQVVMWREDGAEGYKGITMHADLNGDGTIDTSVTFTGIASQSQLPTPLEFSDPALLWFK
jgi:hypothetical protein